MRIFILREGNFLHEWGKIYESEEYFSLNEYIFPKEGNLLHE
jgi:hypothetical protein